MGILKLTGRVLGVVEHGGNRRPGTMTGNLAATILLRDACLAAQHRD